MDLEIWHVRRHHFLMWMSIRVELIPPSEEVAWHVISVPQRKDIAHYISPKDALKCHKILELGITAARSFLQSRNYLGVKILFGEPPSFPGELFSSPTNPNEDVHLLLQQLYE